MIKRYKCVVVANGLFPTGQQALELLRQADFVVACDGAVIGLENGRLPDAVVGDLDSLPEPVRNRYSDRIHRVKDQETNDLTKAVNYVKTLGFREVLILGATGRREDHTLGNISLLAQFKGMHLNNCILNNLDALTSLDLTGLEVDALQITGKNALTLKGSKTLNTNLTINGIPGISFSGIEEVQNVSVSNMPATITGRVEYNFPGLKKIGTLSVSQAYGASLGVLRFPDLTEISGKLTLSEGFGQKVQPTEFPVLRIVNNMTYTGVCDALRFPALEEVTGELNIKTSYVNGSLVSMLQEIYTPVLKKVGILVLTTYSKNQDSWCNNVLTNLDCFRALENVGVINIEYQLGLVSFKGLEKAIGGLTDDTSWVVGHNAYNPTFEQAKNGELERN